MIYVCSDSTCSKEAVIDNAIRVFESMGIDTLAKDIRGIARILTFNTFSYISLSCKEQSSGVEYIGGECDISFEVAFGEDLKFRLGESLFGKGVGWEVVWYEQVAEKRCAFRHCSFGKTLNEAIQNCAVPHCDEILCSQLTFYKSIIKGDSDEGDKDQGR